jgi:hypothetical protein
MSNPAGLAKNAAGAAASPPDPPGRPFLGIWSSRPGFWLAIGSGHRRRNFGPSSASSGAFRAQFGNSVAFPDLRTHPDEGMVTNDCAPVFV